MRIKQKMSHPKEIIFPAINKSVVRRLLLRNNTKTDFAIKLRTNSAVLVIEPQQGFLRAKHTQSISIRLDDTNNASNQSIKIYCRPVSKRTEAECRRWFLTPVEISESKDQLAQTLRIKTSTSFAPLETVLDLPCLAVSVQAEQYPTLMVNDSDTVTARQIDSGTKTACEISETEILAMLPPDSVLNTAEGIDESGWNRKILFWMRPSCRWLEKFFDSVFPPDESQETVGFCGGASR
ncbi:Nicastrin [Dirofilaria immitis]